MRPDGSAKRKRQLDEIVNDYIDILNAERAESKKELGYLTKYASDPEALKLLRGARAVKAMFDEYGDIPDLSSVTADGRKRRR